MRRRKQIWTLIVMTGVLIGSLGMLLPVFALQPAEPVQGGAPQSITARQQASGVFIRIHRVDVTIKDQIARTRIEQVFTNETSQPAEGTYIFPLPPGVTVSDLVMMVDGQPFRARILEKDEAKQVYTGIVQQMRDPALLEYIGTNAIQANIFPIPPGGERTLEIEYSQVLPVESGLVHYVYPLRVDHLSRLPVGTLSIRVSVESNDPISSIYSPTHPVALDRISDTEFVAGFENTHTVETTDFSLYYGLALDRVNLNLLTYRESAQEDGFFLALIAPPVKVNTDHVAAKDVILVLDQSGSMQGVKWDQARAAAQFVLSHLNEEDRFNVVVFSTGVRPFALDLRPTRESADARQWLDTLFAEGGTNIDEAMRMALEQNDREHPVVILFLTDGQPTEGIVDMDAILANVEARTADNVRVFTFGVGDDVNTFLLDELSLRHHGASAYVRPGENIEASVSGLYGKVSAPVLTNLALEFEGMNVFDVYPPLDQMPDLFAGSQLMILGRYRQGKEDATLRLSGQFEGDTQTFEYGDLAFRNNAGGDVLIPRLWATRRIGDLMNAIRLRGEDPELVDSIVRLSIRYGIITPYTSFIITEADVFTEEGLDQAVTVMQPTATALAAMASGGVAVNAAQASGGMYSSNLAPTAAADFQLVAATPTPLPSMTMPPMVATPVATLSAWATQVTAAALPFGTATMTGTLSPTMTVTPAAVVAGLPADSSGPERSVRTVGDRAFVWRDGVWIDTTYNPDEMTPRRIVFLSDDYFDLLDLDERVAEFYALGDHVIFVLDGQAYEVVPE